MEQDPERQAFYDRLTSTRMERRKERKGRACKEQEQDMSAYLVSRVLRADLPTHLKITAAIIATFANNDGLAFVEQGQIAEQLGQSVRQVRRNVQDLQGLGVLSIYHHGNQGGGRGSNSYQFNLDSLQHPKR
jgi:DNA-directed RNA polymerase specialized sigma54-like protein